MCWTYAFHYTMYRWALIVSNFEHSLMTPIISLEFVSPIKMNEFTSPLKVKKRRSHLFFSRLIRIASKIHQNGNGMSNRRHLLMLGSAFNKYLKWTLTIWTLMIFTSLRFFILCPLIISTFSGGQERCAYFGKCPYFGKMCLFWEVEDFES